MSICDQENVEQKNVGCDQEKRKYNKNNRKYTNLGPPALAVLFAICTEAVRVGQLLKTLCE